MQNQKRSLEGVHLVAMKDGQPVENQAEAVAALLGALVAAIRKVTDPDLGPLDSVVRKTAASEREKYVKDIEIECATLRHGLLLADRRYEDAIASTTPKSSQTPDQINSRYSDPVYRCFSCRAATGLHWYRDTACPVCSRPECQAACDAEWARGMAQGKQEAG